MSTLIDTARALATKAHHGQTRRDGTPYITHPEAVAARLAGESDEVIATALLHDTVEDSPLDVDDLRRAGMPESVVSAVWKLTKLGGDYEAYLRNVKTDAIATKVKIADMIHNLSDRPSKTAALRYARGIAFLLEP